MTLPREAILEQLLARGVPRDKAEAAAGASHGPAAARSWDAAPSERTTPARAASGHVERRPAMPDEAPVRDGAPPLVSRKDALRLARTAMSDVRVKRLWTHCPAIRSRSLLNALTDPTRANRPSDDQLGQTETLLREYARGLLAAADACARVMQSAGASVCAKRPHDREAA